MLSCRHEDAEIDDEASKHEYIMFDLLPLSGLIPEQTPCCPTSQNPFSGGVSKRLVREGTESHG